MGIASADSLPPCAAREHCSLIIAAVYSVPRPTRSAPDTFERGSGV
jgi:hypothetical protein